MNFSLWAKCLWSHEIPLAEVKLYSRLLISGNRSPVVSPDVSLEEEAAPARNDSHGRRRGRGGSGRGSGTLGRGGGGSRGHHNRGGRRRGRGARIAAEESEALVEPVAQLGVQGATAGPSQLLNVPAGVEGSSNGRGVRRLRESVTSETEEPPSSRIRTRNHPLS